MLSSLLSLVYLISIVKGHGYLKSCTTFAGPKVESRALQNPDQHPLSKVHPPMKLLDMYHTNETCISHQGYHSCFTCREPERSKIRLHLTPGMVISCTIVINNPHPGDGFVFLSEPNFEGKVDDMRFYKIMNIPQIFLHKRTFTQKREIFENYSQTFPIYIPEWVPGGETTLRFLWDAPQELLFLPQNHPKPIAEGLSQLETYGNCVDLVVRSDTKGLPEGVMPKTFKEYGYMDPEKWQNFRTIFHPNYPISYTLNQVRVKGLGGRLHECAPNINANCCPEEDIKNFPWRKESQPMDDEIPQHHYTQVCPNRHVNWPKSDGPGAGFDEQIISQHFQKIAMIITGSALLVSLFILGLLFQVLRKKNPDH